MATFSKEFLTGSPNGKPIPIVNITAGTAQTIHTVPSGVIEELWLYACNTSDSDYGLTINIDGTLFSELAVPSKSGLVLISPGHLINAGMAITAFSSVANTINVTGWTQRIS